MSAIIMKKKIAISHCTEGLGQSCTDRLAVMVDVLTLHHARGWSTLVLLAGLPNPACQMLPHQELSRTKRDSTQLLHDLGLFTSKGKFYVIGL